MVVLGGWRFLMNEVPLYDLRERKVASLWSVGFRARGGQTQPRWGCIRGGRVGSHNGLLALGLRRGTPQLTPQRAQGLGRESRMLCCACLPTLASFRFGGMGGALLILLGWGRGGAPSWFVLALGCPRSRFVLGLGGRERSRVRC